MRYVRKGNEQKPAILGVFVLACLTFWGTPTWGDEAATAARKIVSQWQDAVVAVQITIEQRMAISGRQMNKKESKIEVGATVIDHSGLAVLSLSSTDPTGILNDLMSGKEEDQFKFDWTSEIKNVKMILADGNEVPAKIVLRDKDLDLAFVYPIEKLPSPVHPLDLSGNTKPEILDQIVILERLGKVAGRVPSVSLSRIQAIVKKPRILYIPGSAAMSEGLGKPVFSLDGKVIGMLLLGIKKPQGVEFGMSNMFGGMSSVGILPSILPAEEIMEVAKQASEAAVDEKKDEEIMQDEAIGEKVTDE
ncbi:MAG: trypsin-like peptidase domain-containing protein [Candidatus Omnitrophica bacterium]|nr:trypsin-like peptidase domain-containing protein [Candidatus Omnitrophota bacterium]